jgi:hypothetical protein
MSASVVARDKGCLARRSNRPQRDSPVGPRVSRTFAGSRPAIAGLARAPHARVALHHNHRHSGARSQALNPESRYWLALFLTISRFSAAQLRTRSPAPKPPWRLTRGPPHLRRFPALEVCGCRPPGLRRAAIMGRPSANLHNNALVVRVRECSLRADRAVSRVRQTHLAPPAQTCPAIAVPGEFRSRSDGPIKAFWGRPAVPSARRPRLPLTHC